MRMFFINFITGLQALNIESNSSPTRSVKMNSPPMTAAKPDHRISTGYSASKTVPPAENLPAPPTLTRQAIVENDESDDDLPLPPPPDDVDYFPPSSVETPLLLGSVSAVSRNCMTPCNVLSSHGSIMQSLNAKLIARNSLQRSQTVTSSVASNPPLNFSSQRQSSMATSSSAKVFCDDEPTTSTQALILRGVQLRRTVSNDRSAPRIEKKGFY